VRSYSGALVGVSVTGSRRYGRVLVRSSRRTTSISSMIHSARASPTGQADPLDLARSWIMGRTRPRRAARSSRWVGRLLRSTIHRHPHITTPFAAPVLDAWGGAELVQLNFARAIRLGAARTLRNGYAVRQRSMKQIERRHNSPRNGGALTPYMNSADRSVRLLTVTERAAIDQ